MEENQINFLADFLVQVAGQISENSEIYSIVPWLVITTKSDLELTCSMHAKGGIIWCHLQLWPFQMPVIVRAIPNAIADIEVSKYLHINQNLVIWLGINAKIVSCGL